MVKWKNQRSKLVCGFWRKITWNAQSRLQPQSRHRFQFAVVVFAGSPWLKEGTQSGRGWTQYLWMGQWALESGTRAFTWLRLTASHCFHLSPRLLFIPARRYAAYCGVFILLFVLCRSPPLISVFIVVRELHVISLYRAMATHCVGLTITNTKW